MFETIDTDHDSGDADIESDRYGFRDDADVDEEIEGHSPDNADNMSDDSELSVTLDDGTPIGTAGKNSKVRIRQDEKPTVKIISKRGLAYPDGYLKLVMGCMFSGKTTYIIRECKKWQSINKNVLMINYAMDKRYSDKDKVVSHDRLSVDCVMVDKFTDKLNLMIENYDVILINEGQFFSDLRKNVKYWCDELKKIVVVSGLDGDYIRGKFGEITDLIPDCDDLIKLKAYCSICKDGTDAIFTWKVIDNPANPKKVLIDIGTDKYVPLCRKHYNEEKGITIKGLESIKS